LWSDPQDRSGQDVSARGGSLMSFGPDVTLKFCHDELIGLVVRSHEVPASGDGFAFHHHNRLCTVFSASNYKGMEHNSGAVLIITSAELAKGNLAGSVRPEVYYAPDLSHACMSAPEPPKELLEEDIDAEFLPQSSAARQTREIARRSAAAKAEAACHLSIKSDDPAGEQIRDEVLQIVAELVVAHKEDLWRALWEKDIGMRKTPPARNGFVKFDVWKDACQSVLGQAISWDVVGKLLGVVEEMPPHTGAVDYNRFLHRFHVCLREDGCVRATWIESVLGQMVDKLVGLSVQDLLDFFDQDKNGRLTIPELASAVKNLDAGLSGAQVRALFLTFATHCDQAVESDIEVESFLSALVEAAREADQHLGKHTRSRSAWPKWASRFLRHLGREIWERGEHQLLDQFKAFDLDGNGMLDPTEFVRIMGNLQASCKSPNVVMLSEAQLRELAKLADFDGSGAVSYLEILLALQPKDTALGGHVRFDLFEQICATVWCHHEALLRAFHTLDEEKTMLADAAMLTKALESLNNTLAGPSESMQPLLPFQIEALVANIQKDENGFVNYNLFLDAFRVVDCA